MKKKECTKCKINKFEDLFYKHKNNPSGLQSHCKECMNTYYKAYIEDHPGYMDKYKGRYKGLYPWQNYADKMIEYKKNNKEKFKIYNAEYQKQYTLDNKMRVKIRQHWKKNSENSDIIKPKCCQICNEKCRTNLFLSQPFMDKLEIKLNKENRVIMRLEDYQSKIKWLCISCIKKIRKNE